MRLESESKWEYLIRRSKENFDRMTEKEKEEMWKKQRESWVRSNMPAGDKRFD